LFLVTRFREELAGGRDPVDAAGVANATAGASVLFAGTTVVIAILGLAIAGIPFVTNLGLGTATAVVVAVAVALTLLPALCGLAGWRINALKVTRHQHRARHEETTGF